MSRGDVSARKLILGPSKRIVRLIFVGIILSGGLPEGTWTVTGTCAALNVSLTSFVILMRSMGTKLDDGIVEEWLKFRFWICL